MSSYYTPRIGMRTELAKALRAEEARATGAGIKLSELDALIEAGEEAREADRLQNVQLAEMEIAVAERSDRDRLSLERGEALRDRIPAAIAALEAAGHTADARLLAALSFARFRLREVGPIPPDLAEDARVKRLVRVEREDRLTRLEGLANLAASLLERPAIVAELADRGMDEATLTSLRDDANTSVRAGKNVRLAAEATARERAAVAQQKERWTALRRMIRKAVQGDPELARLYAQC